MILRLSAKLGTKLKVKPSSVLLLDANPFADWSAHLFYVGRTQFVIVTNTASLYSIVLFGRGIADDGRFVERAMSSLREFMEADGLSFFFEQFIEPAGNFVLYAKALNRSVTGSMNDLIFSAKVWLTEGELSPHDTGFELNKTPMALLDYQNPRLVFESLNPGRE